jgi:hypothetical protein
MKRAMERAARRDARSDDPAEIARVAAEHARMWAEGGSRNGPGP